MISKIKNFLIYILRYFSIINSNYKISSSINFGSKTSNDYFKRLLKTSKSYLEYGSGSSTLLAKKLNKKFISIETDKSFYSFLKDKGIDVSLVDLEKSLADRDYHDSARRASPLKFLEDSMVIDSTDLEIGQVSYMIEKKMGDLLGEW